MLKVVRVVKEIVVFGFGVFSYFVCRIIMSIFLGGSLNGIFLVEVREVW